MLQVTSVCILPDTTRKPDCGVKFVVGRSACEDLAVPFDDLRQGEVEGCLWRLNESTNGSTARSSQRRCRRSSKRKLRTSVWRLRLRCGERQARYQQDARQGARQDVSRLAGCLYLINSMILPHGAAALPSGTAHKTG